MVEPQLASAAEAAALPPPVTPTTHVNDSASSCYLIDTQQAALGDAAFALESLGIDPGTPLPSTALPDELFRMPLIWPTWQGEPLAIGFEQPGNSAGIVFVTRGCVLNTWSYSFGGNGVDFAKVEPLMVHTNEGWHVLVVVEVQGRYRGHVLTDNPDEFAAPGEYHRSVLFAVDEHRVSLLFDTDTLPATAELSLALTQTRSDKISLRVGDTPGSQQLAYEPSTRTLAAWR